MNPPATPTIVMTFLVRDEEEIIADNIWYHYFQGISAFIIMDNLSKDRTPQIIAELSKIIPIDYIQQSGDDYNQSQWVTTMARRAVSQYGADWIINNDADEFWHASRGRLIDVIRDIPPHIGAINVSRVNAVPSYKGSAPSKARTSPRESMLFDAQSTNSLGMALPSKCFHRGSPGAVVAQGNHSVAGVPGGVVDSKDLIIYHFPYQNYAHYCNKILLGGQAYERNTDLPRTTGQTWRKGYDDLQAGRLPEFWSNISYDASRSEYECLRGRFVRDASLAKALLESDHLRGRVIRKNAQQALANKTEVFVSNKAETLLGQLDSFSEAEKFQRPLYQNLPFFLSGARRQQERILDIGKDPDYSVDLDDFRNIASLAPSNPGLAEFAVAALQAAEPVSSQMLRAYLQDKHVVLHVSCEKFVDKARWSRSSFRAIDSEVVNIIVIGRRDCQPDDAVNWNFEYRDRMLVVPTPDSYEMLHRKVLHTLFILSCLGSVRTVTKIDDSLRLADGKLFLETLDTVSKSGAGGAGRLVGARRHAMQVHGWHIGKCSDPGLEARGYSYPLPRDYPAGGYGYVLTQEGMAACAQMYLSMKEFINMPAVGLEDVCVGHAFYAADMKLRDVSDEQHLLALPGLRLVE